MTTTTCGCAPLGLPRLHEDSRHAASAWQRVLDTSGWTRWRLARTRALLLRRAADMEATDPSYAADLRAAALAGTSAR